MLLTIGTNRKSLRRFIELLQEAKVDTVIDTRRNNTSQLAGFAKKEDLEYLLAQAFDIRYEHHPEMAPSQSLLSAFQKDRDWDRYRQGFCAEMETGRMSDAVLALLERHRRPCLLCACDRPDTCHRRLLAEAAVAARPGLKVRHL